jgi:hypothetical protein
MDTPSDDKSGITREGDGVRIEKFNDNTPVEVATEVESVEDEVKRRSENPPRSSPPPPPPTPTTTPMIGERTLLICVGNDFHDHEGNMVSTTEWMHAQATALKVPKTNCFIPPDTHAGGQWLIQTLSALSGLPHRDKPHFCVMFISAHTSSTCISFNDGSIDIEAICRRFSDTYTTHGWVTLTTCTDIEIQDSDEGKVYVRGQWDGIDGYGSGVLCMFKEKPVSLVGVRRHSATNPITSSLDTGIVDRIVKSATNGITKLVNTEKLAPGESIQLYEYSSGNESNTCNLQ